MAFKFVVVLACLAVANAAIPVRSARVAVAPAARLEVVEPVVVEEVDSRPQYNYAYDVQDTLTGDSKTQFETRDGDVVKGEYSLIDPDGFKRTVTYTADPVNGFNAVVTRVPIANTVVATDPIKVAPLAVAAPAVRAAPLVRAAPVVRSAVVAAPVAAPLVAAPIIKPARIRYASAPIVRSAPFAVAPPPAAFAPAAVVSAAQVNYAAPARFTTSRFVNAAPAAYAAAPAFTYV